ncbi:HEPN domain-containing protein [Phorcysia thermohydrogeniphila]|uniref:HEPN domain-containing protein n=1 Tax=Phorcysia thermohydrogeniphila TaxID=936138 RepID=A0A4R1GK25_9BACT|nr:HEPN domain-containing protein [Phorcysia thermohydrogeniphila]TCK06349.1 HEPN domain-containing protein [Phorcysia thermohydrogeniphila]
MKEFPIQILELCRSLLKKRGNEGVYRTIIARSYYAALLYAALWIDENHKKVDWNRKRLHQFVPSHIGQYLPDEYRKTIPAFIHSLRKMREDADYQPAFDIEKEEAVKAFKKAEYIISVLQSLQKS